MKLEMKIKCSQQNLVFHFYHIGATCFLPLYLLLLVRPKSIRYGVQMIQLLVVQFFTTCCSLLRPRYSIFPNTLLRFLFRKINIKVKCFGIKRILWTGWHCREKHLLALSCFVLTSVCPSFRQSVCMHLSCRLPLNELVWHTTFEIL
jgi:hypothetical protein